MFMLGVCYLCFICVCSEFYAVNVMRYYILDIDDTLYLERDYVRSGFEAVGKALGESSFGGYCYDLFLSGVRGNTFDLALLHFGMASVSAADLVSIYRNHEPEIALCDDARRFIYGLRTPVAMITDGPLASQRAKFRALKLAWWIDCPIFTAEIGAPKPSLEPYILAHYALNAAASECVCIADNPSKDFAGAKACGMKTVRIRRPGSLHELEPSGSDVDCEITSLDALLGE